MTTPRVSQSGAGMSASDPSGHAVHAHDPLSAVADRYDPTRQGAADP